jgi:hypothetical protein
LLAHPCAASLTVASAPSFTEPSFTEPSFTEPSFVETSIAATSIVASDETTSRPPSGGGSGVEQAATTMTSEESADAQARRKVTQRSDFMALVGSSVAERGPPGRSKSRVALPTRARGHCTTGPRSP